MAITAPAPSTPSQPASLELAFSFLEVVCRRRIPPNAKRQTPNAKTEALKAQRAERKAARLAAKQKEARDLADFRERARALCSRMPAQFQEWGVTRTRAHLKLMAILKHKAQLKTIKADRLGDLVQRLETSDQWSLPYCQALSQLSDTAVDVSCTE